MIPGSTFRALSLTPSEDMEGWEVVEEVDEVEEVEEATVTNQTRTPGTTSSAV